MPDAVVVFRGHSEGDSLIFGCRQLVGGEGAVVALLQRDAKEGGLLGLELEDGLHRHIARGHGKGIGALLLHRLDCQGRAVLFNGGQAAQDIALFGSGGEGDGGAARGLLLVGRQAAALGSAHRDVIAARRAAAGTAARAATGAAARACAGVARDDNAGRAVAGGRGHNGAALDIDLAVFAVNCQRADLSVLLHREDDVVSRDFDRFDLGAFRQHHVNVGLAHQRQHGVVAREDGAAAGLDDAAFNAAEQRLLRPVGIAAHLQMDGLSKGLVEHDGLDVAVAVNGDGVLPAAVNQQPAGHGHAVQRDVAVAHALRNNEVARDGGVLEGDIVAAQNQGVVIGPVLHTGIEDVGRQIGDDLHGLGAGVGRLRVKEAGVASREGAHFLQGMDIGLVVGADGVVVGEGGVALQGLHAVGDGNVAHGLLAGHAHAGVNAVGRVNDAGRHGLLHHGVGPGRRNLAGVPLLIPKSSGKHGGQLGKRQPSRGGKGAVAVALQHAVGGRRPLFNDRIGPVVGGNVEKGLFLGQRSRHGAGQQRQGQHNREKLLLSHDCIRSFFNVTWIAAGVRAISLLSLL